MTNKITEEERCKAVIREWIPAGEKRLIDGMTIQEWMAIRKEAGLKIDPETAEIASPYVQTLDPYGLYGEPPEECWQIGREYFARSPGSDIWVNFGDLPDAVHDALWKKLTKPEAA